MPAGDRSRGGEQELKKPWLQRGGLVWQRSCRLYPEGSLAALTTGERQQSFRD